MIFRSNLYILIAFISRYNLGCAGGNRTHVGELMRLVANQHGTAQLIASNLMSSDKFSTSHSLNYQCHKTKQPM